MTDGGRQRQRGRKVGQVWYRATICSLVEVEAAHDDDAYGSEAESCISRARLMLSHRLCLAYDIVSSAKMGFVAMIQISLITQPGRS